MPYKSRWSVPIPDCSLPTFLFGSASHTEPQSLANKQCYIDAQNPEKNYLTRSSFRLWSQRFGAGLRKLSGFGPGERILVFSGNNLAFPVAFMGVLMAGGIFSAANPSFVARELANQLKDSGACYLLVAQASLDTALEAAKIAGLPADRIRYFDADALFEKGGMDKGEQKDVKYWNSIFVGESEARGYQWPELKGEFVLLVSCLSFLCCDPNGESVCESRYSSLWSQRQVDREQAGSLSARPFATHIGAAYELRRPRDVFLDPLRASPPVKRTDDSVQAPTKPQKQS